MEFSVSKKIFHRPIFLFILTGFLIALSCVYHLGIVGIIVGVRAIYLLKKAFDYKRSFKMLLGENQLTIQVGFNDPLLNLFIEKENIVGIKEESKGLLFKRPVLFVSLKNGSVIPLDYVEKT